MPYEPMYANRPQLGAATFTPRKRPATLAAVPAPRGANYPTNPYSPPSRPMIVGGHPDGYTPAGEAARSRLGLGSLGPISTAPSARVEPLVNGPSETRNGVGGYFPSQRQATLQSNADRRPAAAPLAPATLMGKPMPTVANQPRRTFGGRGQGPDQGVIDQQIQKSLSIAKHGNFRESAVADLNRRPATLQASPNSLFQGAKPGLVQTGDASRPMRPGFASPATAPQVADNSRGEASLSQLGYYRNPKTGTMSPNNRITDMSPAAVRSMQIGAGPTPFGQSTTPAMAKAVTLASSPERKAYLGKREATLQGRRDNRIARGIERGKRLTDSLDMRRGNMSNAERFMFQNPDAYSRTKLGEGQIGLARSQQEGRDRSDRAKIQAGQSRDRAAYEASLANAGWTADKIKESSDSLYGPAQSGATLQAKPKPPTEAPSVEELKKLSPQERVEALKGFSPATQKRVLGEVSRPSTLQAMADSPFGTFSQYTLGYPTYLGGYLLGLNKRVPEPTLARRPRHADLVDQPGDSPAQRRLRGEMRKKYTGIHTQNIQAGRYSR
jgi:hypothetical protein